MWEVTLVDFNSTSNDESDHEKKDNLAFGGSETEESVELCEDLHDLGERVLDLVEEGLAGVRLLLALVWLDVFS